MVRRLLFRILHDVVTHSAKPTLALGALSVCIAGWLNAGSWCFRFRNETPPSLLHVPPTMEETMVMEARETINLIGSDKIGSIERRDKLSGKVSYAVLSFGGILRIGDDYYPLPWQSLKYDSNLGGYVTGITEAQLQNAPKCNNDNSWNWSDQPERVR